MTAINQFSSITSFFFDMDGVLTDGGLYLLQDGLQVRKMDVKDGYAMQLAIKMGYKIAIISGGTSDEAIIRFKKLGIEDIFLKVPDKKALLHNYLLQNNIPKAQSLFMGDDVPDIAAMLLTAIPCCPQDAVVDVKNIATYISPFDGGRGCARDVIEKVLKVNNHWPVDTEIASI